MQTLADIANSVLASCDTNANLDLAAKWTLERYVTMASRFRLRHLRRVGELLVPGVITGGLVSVTRGGTVVTQDATATALWRGLGESLVGRHIRLKTAWYEIAACNLQAQVLSLPAVELVLKTPFAEATTVDGTYTIAARLHTLAEDAGWFGAFTHPRRHLTLEPVSAHELESNVPMRLPSTGGPMYVADRGYSLDQRRTVELWPYSTDDELVTYVYWAVPRLEMGDLVPAAVDPSALKEGALIDLFRYKSGMAANEGRADLAGFWRNESRAQETRWETILREVVARDRGAEDDTITLRSRFAHSSRFDTGDRDIRTSYDHWLHGL